MGRVRAYIGLGANVGDARSTLTEAVARLPEQRGVAVRGVSRLYRTAPVGVTDQPDFLNAVVALDAPAGYAGPDDGAISLLLFLKHLEREAGRRRRERWGPRELDLDLLVFGPDIITAERPPAGTPLSAFADPAAAGRLLEVPHPQMRDRLFVLAPLADLAPDLVPPGWDETVEEARRRRAAVEGQSAVTVVASWSDQEQTWVGPTGDPIELRRATPGDAEDVARTHTLAADAAYRDLAPPDPGGRARRTAMWREVLADPANRAFVATQRGRIVGILSVGPFREEPAVGAVHVLYVLPEWWGSGAAQQLMELAHEELAKDFERADLTVLAANGRARRFYERNGWELAETLVEPHFGGVPTEVAMYERTLR